MAPFFLLVLLLPITSLAVAQESNRAAVVIRAGEDEILERCVIFEQEELTGYQLIQKSGLLGESKSVGMGAFICQIEETGCPASDCLCHCKGGDDCIYWSYWQLQAGGWEYSQVGSVQRIINDGDVDGWSWGPGSVNEAHEPPVVELDEICADPASIVEVSVEADNRNVESWPAYGAFILIVVLFGGIIIFIRQRAVGK